MHMAVAHPALRAAFLPALNVNFLLVLLETEVQKEFWGPVLQS